MATFSTKSLHFPGGVPKKPKKTKILDSSGLAFAKTLKSLFFLVFLVPPQEMATFSTKSLHSPGGVPKKPKKPKILDFSGAVSQQRGRHGCSAGFARGVAVAVHAFLLACGRFGLAHSHGSRVPVRRASPSPRL